MSFLLWFLDALSRSVLYYLLLQFIESPLFFKCGGGGLIVGVLCAICSSFITLLVAKKTKDEIFWLGYVFSFVIFITTISLFKYLPFDPFPNVNSVDSAAGGLFILFVLFFYFSIMFLLRLYFCVSRKKVWKR